MPRRGRNRAYDTDGTISSLEKPDFLDDDLARCLVASGSTVLEGMETGGTMLSEALFEQFAKGNDMLEKLIEGGLGAKLAKLPGNDDVSIGGTSIEEDLVNLFVKKIEDKMKGRNVGVKSQVSSEGNSTKHPIFKSQALREAIEEIAAKDVSQIEAVLKPTPLSKSAPRSRHASPRRRRTPKKALFDSATSDSDSILSPQKTSSMMSMCPPTSNAHKERPVARKRYTPSKNLAPLSPDFKPNQDATKDATLSPQYSKHNTQKKKDRKPRDLSFIYGDDEEAKDDQQCAPSPCISPIITFDQRQVEPSGLSPRSIERREDFSDEFIERKDLAGHISSNESWTESKTRNEILNLMNEDDEAMVCPNLLPRAKEKTARPMKPIPELGESPKKKDLTVMTAAFSQSSDDSESYNHCSPLGSPRDENELASPTTPTTGRNEEFPLTPIYDNCGPMHLFSNGFTQTSTGQTTWNSSKRATNTRSESSRSVKKAVEESISSCQNGLNTMHKRLTTDTTHRVDQQICSALDPGEPGPSLQKQSPRSRKHGKVFIDTMCDPLEPTRFTFAQNSLKKIKDDDTSLSSGARVVKKVRDLRKSIESAHRDIQSKLRTRSTSPRKRYDGGRPLFEEDIEQALMGKSLPTSSQGSVFFRPTINIYNGTTTISNNGGLHDENASDTRSSAPAKAPDSDIADDRFMKESKTPRSRGNMPQREPVKGRHGIEEPEIIHLENVHSLDEHETINQQIPKSQPPKERVPQSKGDDAMPALFDCLTVGDEFIDASLRPAKSAARFPSQHDTKNAFDGNRGVAKKDVESNEVGFASFVCGTRRESEAPSPFRLPLPMEKTNNIIRETPKEEDLADILKKKAIEVDDSFVSSASFAFSAFRQTPKRPDPPCESNQTKSGDGNKSDHSWQTPDECIENSAEEGEVLEVQERASTIVTTLKTPVQTLVVNASSHSLAVAEAEIKAATDTVADITSATLSPDSNVKVSEKNEDVSQPRGSITNDSETNLVFKEDYAQEVYWKQRVSSQAELFRPSLALVQKQKQTSHKRQSRSVAEIIERRRVERTSKMASISEKTGPLWEALVTKYKTELNSSDDQTSFGPAALNEKESPRTSSNSRMSTSSSSDTTTDPVQMPKEYADLMRASSSATSSARSMQDLDSIQQRTANIQQEDVESAKEQLSRGRHFVNPSPVASSMTDSVSYISKMDVSSKGRSSLSEQENGSELGKSFASTLTVDTPVLHRTGKVSASSAVNVNTREVQTTLSSKASDISSEDSSDSEEDDCSSVSIFARESEKKDYVQYVSTSIPTASAVSIPISSPKRASSPRKAAHRGQAIVSHPQFDGHFPVAKSQPQPVESTNDESSWSSLSKKRLARNYQLRQTLMKKKADAGNSEAMVSPTPTASNTGKQNRSSLLFKARSRSQASSDTSVYFD